jgi:asparagine N-glycosylation enzyme membrane subunit Stt3
MGDRGAIVENIDLTSLSDPMVVSGLLLVGGLVIFLSPLINVLQLFGILLVLGGILIYTTGSLRVVSGVRHRLQNTPAHLDAATAAMRAADSANLAAAAVKPKKIVEYLPSLDMFYADKSVGAYLSDNMFKITDPHPARTAA